MSSLNKAIEGFCLNTNKTRKYGKWLYKNSRLSFDSRIVAKREGSKVTVYGRKYLTDCRHEYATYYALQKAVRYLLHTLPKAYFEES